ncbi:MAG: hypothetical protein HY423_01455 [Candidatus Lambdaproteobacteria bacterium]|nr:hypothetical protein [Candidatus Lambdaproteobacteria bacterium]
MTESTALLTASTALALLALALQRPQWRDRLGRAGAAWVTAGTVLPLTDFALGYLATGERIEALARDPLFYVPAYGLTALAGAALVAAIAWGGAQASRAALLVGLGYGLHLALAVLTPTGLPLLAPFSPDPIGVPLSPAGHPLLLGLLLALLAADHLPGRTRPWLKRVALAGVALYGSAAIVQWGWVAWRAQTLRPPGGSVSVEPADPFLTEWLVVGEGRDTFEVRRQRAFAAAWEEPVRIPRWNHVPETLALLADPLLQRLYYRLFRQPVVRVEQSGARTHLFIQEVRDQAPPSAGATLYVESDANAQDRLYQLQRLD